MADFALYILTAIALICVIEGMAYALFPDLMRKMMAIAIMAPVPKLRLFGAVMAASGFCLILLMR